MQSVEINNKLSSFNQIKCGVPQGSILGPLLFILYINDIVHVSSKMKPILFADDTNLLLHNENLVSTANVEVQKISDWLKVNKLSLNIKKTHFVVFHNRQKLIPEKLILKIDNVAIDQVSETKFLGVILHENLSWKPHILILKKKICKNIGILKALQYRIPTSCILHRLPKSHLHYPWKTTFHVENLVLCRN